MKVDIGVLSLYITVHCLCNLGLGSAAENSWPPMNIQRPMEAGYSSQSQSQSPQFANLFASLTHLLEQISLVQQRPAPYQQAYNIQAPDHAFTPAPTKSMDPKLTVKYAGPAGQLSQRASRTIGRGVLGVNYVRDLKAQAPLATPASPPNSHLSDELLAVGAAEAPSEQHADVWDQANSRVVERLSAPAPALDHAFALVPRLTSAVESPEAESAHIVWQLEPPELGPISPTTVPQEGLRSFEVSSAMPPRAVTEIKIPEDATSPSTSTQQTSPDSTPEILSSDGGPIPLDIVEKQAAPAPEHVLASEAPISSSSTQRTSPDSTPENLSSDGGPIPLDIVEKQAAPAPEHVLASEAPTSSGPQNPISLQASGPQRLALNAETRIAHWPWLERLSPAESFVPLPSEVNPLAAQIPDVENAQVTEPVISNLPMDDYPETTVPNTSPVTASQVNIVPLPSAGPQPSYEGSAQPVILASGRNQQDPGFNLIKAVYTLIQTNDPGPVSLSGPEPLLDAKSFETLPSTRNSRA
eukprot:jgi/Botrbrau1/5301/Bobra.0391s0019.1